MKSIKKLLVFGLFSGLSGVSLSQISNAVQPEIPMAPASVNTGIAMCPNYDLNAAVFDWGAGGWKIYWIEGATGIVQDADGNSGSDPDVAYFDSYKGVEVAFEDGGGIFVDEFYLNSLTPLDYVRNATFFVSSGQYPNIDINSSQRGVLSWEDGGDIYACTFSVAPFTAGPIVQVGTNARQPDIILLDDNNHVALTYVDTPTGKLVVETMSYPALLAGVHSTINMWTYPPMTYYEFPRIASQRNQNFGPLGDFAVVAQDFNGVGAEVHGVFVQSAVFASGAVLINNGLQNCPTADPRPVVTFNRIKSGVRRIDIEWSQYYFPTCTSVPFSGGTKDILLAEFSTSGFNINGPTSYAEVNQIQSDFPFVSRHSISTPYDGLFPLTPGSFWREGTVFNDSGTMYWKERNSSIPVFIDKPSDVAADQVTFSLVNSPVTETIEVVSKNDAPASFELYDNSGRLLELKEISANGNNYSIDISHLPGGTYLLRCSSTADEEVLRVLQVNR